MPNEVGFLRKLRAVAAPIWKNALIGGISFWLPDVVYNVYTAIEKAEPTRLAVLLLTLGMPLAVGFVYMGRRGRREFGSVVMSNGRSVALSMLLGIWAVGPTMIMLGQTPAGAGFKSGPLALVLLMIVLATLVPVYTYILSTYDLTLFALLLGTVCLIVLHRKYEKGRGLFRAGAAR